MGGRELFPFVCPPPQASSLNFTLILAVTQLPHSPWSRTRHRSPVTKAQTEPHARVALSSISRAPRRVHHFPTRTLVREHEERTNRRAAETLKSCGSPRWDGLCNQVWGPHLSVSKVDPSAHVGAFWISYMSPVPSIPHFSWESGVPKLVGPWRCSGMRTSF